MNKHFEEYLSRKQREFGDKFDPSELSIKFQRYFGTDTRIKIREFPNEDPITGTVGITTGHKPAFLLMRRSNSTGNSVLLSDRTELIAVRNGNKYYPIS